MKKKKVTKKQLEVQVLELKAQLASSYHFASVNLNKLSGSNLTGSGVVLQLNYLGGKEAINPVMIKDGFSPETIRMIKDDIERSFNLAVMFRPESSNGDLK